jgi:MoaD family protein
MTVHIKGFFQIKEAMGGHSECYLETRETDIESVLRLLGDIYGERFRVLIFDESEAVVRANSILLNGKHYRTLPDGLRTIVADGDFIAIFPPAAGG